MNLKDFLDELGGGFLAALFGVAGVVLGRFIAQAASKDGSERMSFRLNMALTTLFSLVVIAYVHEDPTISPLRVLGYATAAGFLGLGLLEFMADQLFDRFKAAFRAFLGSPAEEHDDDETRINRAMEQLHEIKEDADGPSK